MATEEVRRLKEENRRLKEELEQKTHSEEFGKGMLDKIAEIAQKTGAIIFKMRLNDGVYEYIFGALYEITGVALEEAYHSSFLIKEVIHPDWHAFIDKEISNAKEGQEKQYIEFPVLHRNGETRWLRQDNFFDRDEEGNITAIEGIVFDITEKKKLEQQLEKKEAFLKALLNNLPFDVWVRDRQEKVTFQNQRSVDLWGNTMGTDIDGSPEDEGVKKDWRKNNQRAFNGEIVDYEREINLRGQQMWLRKIIAPVWEGDEISGILGLNIDVTAEKRTRRKLKLEQERIRAILDNLTDLIFIVDEDTRVLYASPSAISHLGYSKEQLIGLKGMDMVHPDDIEKVQPELDEVIDRINTYVPTEFRLKKANGEWLQVEAVANNRLDNPVINGMVVSVRDISERKKFEQELREAEQTFRNLFMNSQVGLFRYDYANRKMTAANDMTVRILGYKSQKDLLDLFSTQQHIISDDDYQELKGKVERNEELKNIELMIRDKKDNQYWVRLSGKVNSEKQWIEGVIEDITTERHALDSLVENERKFRLIFNSNSEAIIIFDMDTFTIVEANEVFQKEMGYKWDECRHMPLLNIVDKNYHAYFPDRLRRLKQGEETPSIEVEAVRKDGSTLPVEIKSKKIYYEGREMALSVARDVRERKEMERRIIDSMMEGEEQERRRIASDLHDDIGPLLSSLKLYISVIQNARDEEKRAHAIEKSSVVAQEIINNVRFISNALSPYTLQNFGLSAAIDSLVEMTGDFITIEREIRIQKLRFPENVENVFFRVLKELVNNTIKHAGATTINIRLTYAEGLLILSYNDDGVGFDYQSHMQKQGGKGLGLLNILSRVRSIGGTYDFYSQPGDGVQAELRIKTQSEERRQ